ncbi:MAG: tetratricopeptide repeat protein [Gammaproteobacteria bacterium]|nr:tetratricopeptide repeat protein [Gammaproteobacteria bacterium]
MMFVLRRYVINGMCNGGCLAMVLLVLLFVGACGAKEESQPPRDLPEIPVIGLEQLSDTIKNQFGLIQQQLAERPLDGGVNKTFARLLHAYSLTGPAAVMYRRCELLRPHDLDCLYLHALVQKELGNYTAAIDNLSKVLARKTTFPRAAIVLADSYRITGEHERAAQIYQEALRHDAKLLEARYGLAVTLLNQGQLDKAYRHLQKIHAGKTRYGVVHTALAGVYRQTQNTEEVVYHTAAAKRFADVKIPYTDELLWEVQQLQIGASRYTRDADRLFKAGRLEEAARLYHKTLEINPENDSSHANLVGIYGQLGQLDKAQEHYELAIALNPSNVLPHMNLGTVLMKSADFSGASTVFAKVLQRQPRHAEARTLHTYCAQLLQQPYDVKQYRLALRDDSTLPLANYLLGRHIRAADGCAAALPFLEKSVRIENAGTVAFMADYATCLFRQEQQEAGADVIRRGRRLAQQYRNQGALRALDQVKAQFMSSNETS